MISGVQAPLRTMFTRKTPAHAVAPVSGASESNPDDEETRRRLPKPVEDWKQIQGSAGLKPKSQSEQLLGSTALTTPSLSGPVQPPYNKKGSPTPTEPEEHLIDVRL